MTTETRDLVGRVATIAPKLAEEAEISERERRLTDRAVEAMKEQRLIGIWVPESLGGLEASPTEGFEMLEAVAKIDASTAWNLWIWSTVGQLSATLPEEGVAEMFANGPNGALGAGGIFPPNPATVVEGGYRVTGRWPFASGSGHAQWLGGGCMVIENGEPRMMMPGMPEIRFVTFPRQEVEIIDTWHVVGLRATGSNDIAVEDQFVPEHRTSAFGPMTPKGKHFQGPLYRFPVMGVLGGPIGAIALGIAQHAIDAFTELAATKTPRTTQTPIKEMGVMQSDVAKARAAVQSARSWMFEVVENAWQATLRGDPVALDARSDLALAATNATRSAAYAVDLMYTAAGGTSVYQASPLERCFRDIHAATQHAGTSSRNFEATGRMLLGLAPDNPMLLL